jgi:uncharacterized membrane protein
MEHCMASSGSDRFWFLFVPMKLTTAQRLVRLLLPITLVLFLAALAARLIGTPTLYTVRYEAESAFWLWLHLGTVVPSIPLALYLLAKPKGTANHRLLGKIWCILMLVTALAAFMVRGYFLPNWHGINPIHIFSALTLIGVPRIILAAKRHDIASHQQAVYGLCLGGLFFAGLFAFLPNRLLGRWLFSLLA